MSRLQAIEHALSAINQASFQELCDSFLALRNSNYSAFSRTGSQSGKQKTIKGTPDTFLLLPNGKYIFVEYSTNITAGVKKLEDDVKKCIDAEKTGIPINQIDEIIICVNFNLTTSEIQALKNIVSGTRILLTVYTLDSLSIELHLNHRDLTHEYLGLPLDTGQIISVEKFIAEYNRASKGISTPLDNTFLHRDQELSQLKEVLHLNNFIILTGAPGIGKTKLALEGIQRFLSENMSFQAYCVSYKSHTLLEDLYQYFNSEKDYILFVDDANRIDAFSQITGFYRAPRKGKLKIIITVRDYAFQDIGILCQEFAPVRLDLPKFSDEQIIDIIKAPPFDILNPMYQTEIVRIADGNPRLAIMTALLAKAHQNISVLNDVSDLFERYFSTFIKDDGEFAKKLNIKCLGLIAFFYTIPYKNREVTIPILNNFGIDYPAFIDAIDKLDKLELVEIQFEHVKIPEQNLSTYFFYKAFIKDNLLSFEILLNKYFDENSIRFRDCVIPANNTFGPNKVMHKLQPFLQNFWSKINTEEEKAFKFLSIFWFYLQTETLEFIFNLTDSFPAVTPTTFEVRSARNEFSYSRNNVIDLLGEFLRYTSNLTDTIELGFEYVRKKPEHAAEWIHRINEQLTFDRDDELVYGFQRQIILFKVLLTGLNKGDLLLSQAFYELSKTFLSFTFNHAKSGRNNSFYWYHYSIPNDTVIQDFRKNIWNAVKANFNKHRDPSFDLLLNYMDVGYEVTVEIVQFDLPFIVEIVEEHLNVNSFEHCKYVQEQIRWWKRNSASHPSLQLLKEQFTNPTYELFCKIDWDRLRDKEMYEFDDYKEYEKLKEAEIRDSFIFKDAAEINEFYNSFIYLKKNAKNEWNFNTTLDFIIDENYSKSFLMGYSLLLKVIENNNEANYIPRVVLKNNLKTAQRAKKIWNLIKDHEFAHQELWELSFYDYLDESLLNKEYVDALIHTIANIKEATTIHFDRLQRFLPLEPKLFQIILKTIVEKNEKEGSKLQLWMDFFSVHFQLLGDDIELIKKAYLQQDKIHNYFDYEGKGFLNILNKDPNFLIEFVENLYSDRKFEISGNSRIMGYVWQVDNIEGVLMKVFDLVIEKEPYFGISEHFCNSFFRNLQNENKEKAKNFLFSYSKSNYSLPNKMNVIVDIVRHSMKEYFEDILLFFLSLTQDKELFAKISWRGNSTSGVGDVILADIEMADWMNILSITEKSTAGIKLIPIKRYLNERIEICKKQGDWERQRRFLERY